MKNFLKTFLNKAGNRRSTLAFFIMLVAVIYFFVSIDIGLFSKRFIKKDFETAFLARQTGNCERFVSYLLVDQNSWRGRCEKERDGGEASPIKDFSIQEITVEGNEAFLQVELIRDNYEAAATLAFKGHDLPEGGYLVSYRMKRNHNRWYINQEMR